MTLPPLFNKAGVLVELDEATISSLTAPQRDAYIAVKNSAEQLAAADEAVLVAKARVIDAVADERAAEAHLNTIRPPRSAVSVAKEHILSERATRAARFF